MRHLTGKIAAFLGIAVITGNGIAAETQPNILWIITDDHRPDSIQAYNRATTGKRESELGYVASPNIDKLASEGDLFTHAYCNFTDGADDKVIDYPAELVPDIDDLPRRLERPNW